MSISRAKGLMESPLVNGIEMCMASFDTASMASHHFERTFAIPPVFVQLVTTIYSVISTGEVTSVQTSICSVHGKKTPTSPVYRQPDQETVQPNLWTRALPAKSLDQKNQRQ